MLAAGQTLSGQGAPRGTRSECLARAGEMLERALQADPESLPAVGLLVAVRGEEGSGRDRLVEALRGAFDRARATQVVVQLGAELARLAAVDPPDRLLAVDALRRVLVASPGHLPTLRALADHCAAMEAWGDAVDALEPIAAGARDPAARLAALFDLADVFGPKLARPADVERVLRQALDVDPMSVEALRRLLAHRRADGAAASEIATWLARLGEAETTPEAKATVLTELAELLRRAGDAAGAEKALIEATAQSPKASRLSRLAGLFTGAPSEHARALNAVVSRGRELDRPDAACFAALGRLEVDALGRWAEGVGHLRLAVGLAPAMHEARAALARGLTHLRAGGEAITVLLPMLLPDAAPLLSLGDPAAALGTLEAAFAAEGRHDEATVVRELRAVAGGLDDGAHAELRARRLPSDPAAPVLPLLDAAMLRANVVPEGVAALLFDLSAAIAGAASKFARVEMDDLGVSPRGRLTGHPLLVYRLAKMFGLEAPDVVTSGLVTRPESGGARDAVARRARGPGVAARARADRGPRGAARSTDARGALDRGPPRRPRRTRSCARRRGRCCRGTRPRGGTRLWRSGSTTSPGAWRGRSGEGRRRRSRSWRRPWERRVRRLSPTSRRSSAGSRARSFALRSSRPAISSPRWTPRGRPIRSWGAPRRTSEGPRSPPRSRTL